MALPRYTKHPSDIVAYPIDVLGLGSNTIGVVSSAISPAGITETSTTASGNRVTALLAAGSDGVLYQIEVTINISNGELRVHEFEIMVVDN